MQVACFSDVVTGHYCRLRDFKHCIKKKKKGGGRVSNGDVTESEKVE